MEIYMKKLGIVILAVMLSACSSLGGGKKDERSVKSEFFGGDIKVSYTMGGEFESIASSGTARVTSNAPDAAEKAYIVASLRARQQLVEFMKAELESEKFKQTVYKTLQEAEEELKVASSTVVKDNITSELQENIKQRTNAILRGTYVDSKEFDRGSSTVKVVVKSSTRDIEAAKSLSRLMGN
jgi:hypothetical protein